MWSVFGYSGGFELVVRTHQPYNEIIKSRIQTNVDSSISSIIITKQPPPTFSLGVDQNTLLLACQVTNAQGKGIAGKVPYYVNATNHDDVGLILVADDPVFTETSNLGVTFLPIKITRLSKTGAKTRILLKFDTMEVLSDEFTIEDYLFGKPTGI